MIARSDIKWRGFYFITDHSLSLNGVIEDTKLALEAGSVFVQYRMKFKNYPYRELEAKTIGKICDYYNVPFIVNDDVEFAEKVKSDGVHLGQEDASIVEARQVLGPDAIIGVSVSNLAELQNAVENGADYVAASPVFFTSTKLDIVKPIGLEGLRLIRSNTNLPLCAIGGIDCDNIKEVAQAGADLICAISASLINGSVKENITKLLELAGFKD